MNAKGMRPVAVESANHYTTLMDYDASTNLIYLGKAEIGTATATAAWQIKKFAYDASSNLTSVKWAGGNEAFGGIWDNRASLSYS